DKFIDPASFGIIVFNNAFSNGNGSSGRRIEFVDVMYLFDLHIVLLVGCYCFCQKSIDMKKDIHPYTEVGAIQKRLLVALAIGLYLVQVFVPTCRADHNWKVSFKTKGNIR